MAFELSHAQRVTRLYRRSLKHLLSWAIDRSVWRHEAVNLRARFDANKHVKDMKRATALLEAGERDFEKHKHPSPYISPEEPEGSKWERNLPPPQHVLVMTADEERWYREAMKD